MIFLLVHICLKNNAVTVDHPSVNIAIWLGLQSSRRCQLQGSGGSISTIIVLGWDVDSVSLPVL